MNQIGRIFAVIGWIAIVAGLIAVAVRMRPDPSLITLVPQGDQELMRQISFFDERSASQLLFLEASGAETPAMLTVLREAARELESVGATPIAPPGASREDAITPHLQAGLRLDDAVYQHLPVLVPPQVLADLDQRISTAALRSRLQDAVIRLQQPGTELLAARLYRDVLNLEDEVLAVIGAGFVGRPQSMTSDGILRHADGQHAAMVFQIAFPPGDAERSAELMTAVRELAEQASTSNVHLEAVGAYRHFDDNYRQVNRDLLITLPISLLVIFIILWSLFRKKRDIIAVHMPGLAGIATAAASAVIVFGTELPLPVLGFGAAMLGIAVDYGIHMTRAVREGRAELVTRPLLLSFATAGSAFAVLMTSDVSALRVLGVYVVCGLAAALLTALLVLPRVLRRRQQRDPWRRVAEPLVLSGHRFRWAWVCAAILLTAGAVPGLMRLTLVDDPHNLDGSSAATLNVLQEFRERWGGLGGNHFLVANASEQDAAIAAITTARREYQLPFGPPELLLPTAVEQGHRLTRWETSWHQRLSILKTNLEQVCTELGLRASAFDPSFASYSRTTSTAVTNDTWTGTPVVASLAEYVVTTESGFQVMSPVTNEDLVPGLLESTATADSDTTSTSAWLASRHRLGKHLVDSMLHELAWRGIIIAAVMALVLMVLVRHPLRVAAILIPPGIALVWTFGTFGWLGIQLNALHILVGAFVAGIGIDDAIFLSRTNLRNHVMSPILATTATTTAGVGVLAIAGHPALYQVGIAVAIGMACCLLACLCLSPAFDLPSRSTIKTLKPEDMEAALKKRSAR